jgi:RNA-directed DNA polymerase
MTGRSYLIRYADDFVIGFTDEKDARRVMDVLAKRFAKYGLTLHPDKTRLIPFHRPQDSNRSGGTGSGEPGTFDLLGFTHYWSKSRKGRWVVKRKTASSRLSRAMRTIADWCQRHRHLPVGQQHQILCRKLRGHYGYYGITGNAKAISCFRLAVTRTWRKWLAQRKRGDHYSWALFNRLLERHPLPAAVVVHSVYGRAAKP